MQIEFVVYREALPPAARLNAFYRAPWRVHGQHGITAGPRIVYDPAFGQVLLEVFVRGPVSAREELLLAAAEIRHSIQHDDYGEVV